MPGESYCRRLRSLLLCLCDIFWVLINSLACWFCMSGLGLVLFQIVFILKHLLSVFVASVLTMKPLALSFPYPSLTCSMHMYACACTHMYAHACIHMHMHACTYAHTHTHMHTPIITQTLNNTKFIFSFASAIVNCHPPLQHRGPSNIS